MAKSRHPILLEPQKFIEIKFWWSKLITSNLNKKSPEENHAICFYTFRIRHSMVDIRKMTESKCYSLKIKRIQWNFILVVKSDRL